MASHPDDHPDSAPPERSDQPEQVSPGGGRERETVEDVPAGDHDVAA